ncbi:hypothetical protein CKM354_000371000 [Cercospora kikuchii]|uniref:Cell wall mannoprotein PIR1-like C-terminal domain-containing protein n=1 Tax=Cercospora kikuchii TaxID=84275 RepID=A0A9P3CCE4_9PEZI|nr:uncharacterized protein CKM354_000371000 [Cercospora kikuchii]GIZ40369.1 hypothetical protein CKM354_000371000 [Cercospora kikuchii]
MRYSIAPVALAALAAANPVPQGVTENITPSTSAPAGCSPDYPGTFQIQVVNVTTPAMVKRQQQGGSGTLILTLQGGVLKDAQGRTGYIADNRQFQFDGPAQTGAIYTAGWSVCQNGSLAIGSDVVFQQCLSGTFYNLYDESDAAQCSPVYIEAINGGGSAAQVQSDGQPTAQPVNQIADGQPQAVTQIADGQVSSHRPLPTTLIFQQLQLVHVLTPLNIQAPTGAPVSQIADGQIQAATSGSPVSQIADGQVTPTGAPVTQIADGQVQAPTGSPVTQIADGQIQAPQQTGSPVTQIADGQAPTNGSVASPSVVPYTGAAAIPTMRSELFGLAAGVLAVAML